MSLFSIKAPQYLATSGVSLTVASSDGTVFRCPFSALKRSKIIADMVEGVPCTPSEIPLPIRAATLLHILGWCEEHEGEPEPTQDCIDTASWSVWDIDFAHRLEWKELADVYLGAHFMEIEWLKELAAWEVGKRMKGLMPDELGAMFNMLGDLTPDESGRAYESVLPFLHGMSGELEDA
ncbi:hypothetical protein BKA70DRAFT_362768 [Coprinopsis sp. MPI-PUGE-AT-0042]|nr:hypothetical protein BKA70DRAFT_362768 [Coprinopsis sp. MPI-PUGE-AT-0042]